MKIIRARGFTLLELMVSLALVALLASLAMPLQELTAKRSQETELRAALRQIREGLDAYKQATVTGQIIVQPGDSGYPKTLALLVSEIKDARSPTAAPLRFLRRIPRDPLADPGLQPEESWGQRSYLSTYDQPSPGDDVYDVYSLNLGTGINGIPYRQW